MRATNLTLTTAAIGLFLGIAALPGIANATDISQAIEMCEERGPDCVHYYDGDGHEVIVVENDGGKQTVICSHQSRDCVVARRQPRRPVRRTTIIDPEQVAGIQRGSPVRSSRPN
jgi:hypothetical protein